MAEGAGMAGCAIKRKIQVNAYAWTGSVWIVTCERMIDKGGTLIPSGEIFEIRAEHGITAIGNHAQRTPAWHPHSGDRGRTPVHRGRTRPRAA